MQEEWKVIEELPNYKISNFGNVMNIKKDKLMKKYLTKDGTHKVKLYKTCLDGGKRNYCTRQVGRLVAINFLGWDGNRSETITYSDGNKLNNHVDNLDIIYFSVLVSQTKKNSGKNSSKYRGVSLHKQTNTLIDGTKVEVKAKWLAHICINRKVKHLGVFETEIEAAEAYNEAFNKAFNEN